MKLVVALQELNNVRLFQEDAFLYLAVNWVGPLVTRSVVLCSRQGRLPSSGVFQLSSFQECLALSGSSYCLVNIRESGMVIALLSVQWTLDIPLLFSIKWKPIGQADCNRPSVICKLNPTSNALWISTCFWTRTSCLYQYTESSPKQSFWVLHLRLQILMWKPICMYRSVVIQVCLVTYPFTLLVEFQIFAGGVHVLRSHILKYQIMMKGYRMDHNHRQVQANNRLHRQLRTTTSLRWSPHTTISCLNY